jgi:hypothetical protein
MTVAVSPAVIDTSSGSQCSTGILLMRLKGFFLLFMLARCVADNFPKTARVGTVNFYCELYKSISIAVELAYRKATNVSGMSLLLDQNVSHRLVAPLSEIYPGTTQVGLLGLGDANDREVRDLAQQEAYVLVSLVTTLAPGHIVARFGNFAHSPQNSGPIVI